MSGAVSSSMPPVWSVIGAVGGFLFFGRFYVQWIVSELRKRSVMPVAFWYMSTVGTLMLMAYAVAKQSPLGALSQCMNIVIYSRNLVHIFRERGQLSRGADRAIHVVVALIAVTFIYLTFLTWSREVADPKGATHEHAQTWCWLVVGLVGQALFALRFLVQWLATERLRKSVIPPAFWHFSLWGAILTGATFFQRHEWVFALGAIATMPPYLRNLWLIYMHPERAEQNAEG